MATSKNGAEAAGAVLLLIEAAGFSLVAQLSQLSLRALRALRWSCGDLPDVTDVIDILLTGLGALLPQFAGTSSSSSTCVLDRCEARHQGAAPGEASCSKVVTVDDSMLILNLV